MYCDNGQAFRVDYFCFIIYATYNDKCKLDKTLKQVIDNYHKSDNRQTLVHRLFIFVLIAAKNHAKPTEITWKYHN